MKKVNLLILMAVSGFLFLTSCGNDDDNTIPTSNLTLDLTGLQDLGEDYRYEGWIMVDGTPVSAGVFSVDADGNLSQTSFSLPSSDVEAATKYILTIEPYPDSDPAPSSTHIIAGDFNGNSAPVNVSDSEALNTDFADATGKYFLATPTDDIDTNELDGVWFIENPTTPGLVLPTLPAGWKYEGWMVFGTNPVSTGKFTSPSGADESSLYSGTTGMAPPFPGEDFLMNAPAGLTFPMPVTGQLAVISVEPDPDNSPLPFIIKPLQARIAADAAQHSPLDMINNVAETLPSGTVSR